MMRVGRVLLWKTRRCERHSWEEEFCFLSCGSAFLLYLVRTCLSTAIDFIFINLVKKIYDSVVAGKANNMPHCPRGTTSESDFSVNTAKCGNTAVWFGFHSSVSYQGRYQVYTAYRQSFHFSVLLQAFLHPVKRPETPLLQAFLHPVKRPERARLWLLLQEGTG